MMAAEQAIESTRAIRQSPDCVSNVYFVGRELLDMFHAPSTSIFEACGLIAIIQKEEKISRLYFYASSLKHMDGLGRILSKIGTKVVTDIIGRRNETQVMIKTLCEQCGFKPYDKFIHMVATNPVFGSTGHSAESAKPSEAQEILDLIEDEFDLLTAHFPTLEGIENAIRKNEVAVIRDGGKIAGLAWFEQKGTKHKELKYLLVSKESRKKGGASSLFASENLKKRTNERYSLWVSEKNPAVDWYVKRRFSPDGVTDNILVYEGG